MFELNKAKKSCDKNDILNYVSDELQGGIVGTIESWASKNTKIKKHKIDLTASIYKDRSLGDVVFRGSILSLVGLESSIKLNDAYIGVDKLGHFFDQGYGQYLIAYKEGRGVRAALEKGISQEESFHGEYTTGIKSFGDLSANYAGMKFWKNLSDGDGPYFRCKNNQWEKSRKFTFKDYVDPSWDEAINCSVFNRDSLQTAVLKNSIELEKKNSGKKFICPVDHIACLNFQKNYPKEVLAYIITPQCLSRGNSPLKPSMCLNKLSSNIISSDFTVFCEKIIGKLK